MLADGAGSPHLPDPDRPSLGADMALSPLCLFRWSPERSPGAFMCFGCDLWDLFGLGQDLLTFAAFLGEIFLHKEPSLFC